MRQNGKVGNHGTGRLGRRPLPAAESVRTRSRTPHSASSYRNRPGRQVRLDLLDEPLAESVGSDAAPGNRLVEDGVEQVVVESELARRSVAVEMSELDGVGGAGGTSGRADLLVASAELVVQMGEQRAHERRLAIVAQ